MKEKLVVANLLGILKNSTKIFLLNFSSYSLQISGTVLGNFTNKL